MLDNVRDLLKYDKLKISGVALSLLGIGVACWLVNFLYGTTTIDLVTPTILGQSVIDCLVTAVLVGFAVMAFAQRMADKSTAKTFLFGVPMAVLNLFTAYVWWEMELVGTTTYMAAIAIFILVTAGNVFLAMEFAMRDGF